MRAGTLAELDSAIEDLERRTLADLPGELTRLVYLSSTRDYNTGEYQHAGLSDRFGPKTAQLALERCHEAAFRNVLNASLANLVGLLAQYIDSTGAEREKVLDAWTRLQAYRVLIPAASDDLSSDFFASSIRIALEVLRAESGAAPAG